MRFELEEKTEKLIQLFDLETGYNLLVKPNETDTAYRIHFVTNYAEPNYPITARDCDAYNWWEQLNPGPDEHVVEVGAGLGQFATYIADLYNPIDGFDPAARFIPPTVIDPTDYRTMQEMLQASKAHVPLPMIEDVDEIIRRCNTVLNPERITLINMTLGTAIHEHPELLKSADVVVDNYGASRWSKTEGLSSHDAVNAARKLLKPNGQYYGPRLRDVHIPSPKIHADFWARLV
jgi:hypothetical protein